MKRAEQLIPLSHDHHQGLVLAQGALRLKDSLQAADVTKAWQNLKDYLQGQAQQHFLIEERFLLEPLSAFIEQKDLVARIYDEHKQFREFAEKPVGQDIACLLDVAALLKAHIKFEEKQVFEIAQSLLTEAQLDAVMQAHG